MLEVTLDSTPASASRQLPAGSSPTPGAPLSSRGPRPPGVILVRAGTGLNGVLRKLKRDWAENFAGSVRRHECYRSPGERRRLKSRRARKRAAQNARKSEEDQARLESSR